jgi:hypothetical protein
VTVSGLGPRDVHVWSTATAQDRDLAIRSVLARYLGVPSERVPMERDASGRRIVATPGLSLSVSRSGDKLLIGWLPGSPLAWTSSVSEKDPGPCSRDTH